MKDAAVHPVVQRVTELEVASTTIWKGLWIECCQCCECNGIVLLFLSALFLGQSSSGSSTQYCNSSPGDRSLSVTKYREFSLTTAPMFFSPLESAGLRYRSQLDFSGFTVLTNILSLFPGLTIWNRNTYDPGSEFKSISYHLPQVFHEKVIRDVPFENGLPLERSKLSSSLQAWLEDYTKAMTCICDLQDEWGRQAELSKRFGWIKVAW